MPETTLVGAVNMALAHAMAEDPSVVVLGEDVGANGGVFRATDGLLERFGAERVIDTPLAELAIGGVAVGMAAQGLRPVAEIQFIGLHLSGDRPDRQPRRAPAQPHPRPAVLPDGAARALRRRHPRARASFGEHRGDVRPHARAARRHPVLAAARLRAAAGGDPRSRSGGVPGADADLPRGQAGRAGRRRGLAARHLLRAARGQRRHPGHLGRHGQGDARRGRGAQRRGGVAPRSSTSPRSSRSTPRPSSPRSRRPGAA